MASLYIRYYGSLARDANGTSMPAVDESTALGNEIITIGASSAEGASVPSGARIAMLHSEAACHYTFGISPTATGNSMRMPADLTLIVGVRSGPSDKKFAVIQD